jgi:hypothetical protein
MRIPVSVVVASVLTSAVLLNPAPSQAAFAIGVSITVAPPELPVYEQPEIPGEGYIWTPGYWAWSDDGYYWVPGTWVQAPEPGLLWTPGYLGWDNGYYQWHTGYWGNEIGFYGGVNYGFGYFGHGYDGGYWEGGRFRYNGAYSNVRGNREIVNVYNKTVINNITVNHVSYNGGNGGLRERPDQRELGAEHAHHIEPVAAQIHQRESAQGNPDLRANFNHGHPPIAATSHAGEFSGRGVIAAHGAPPAASHAPAIAPAGAQANPSPRFQAEQHGQPQVPGRQMTSPPTQVQHNPAPPQSQGQPQYERTPNSVREREPAPSPPVQQVQHAPPAQQNYERTAPPVQPVHLPPQQQVQHAPQPPPQQQHAPPPPPAQQTNHPQQDRDHREEQH